MMKNKILTLLLLSTISTFSFSAEMIALKSGDEDAEALANLKPASHLFSAAEQEDFETGMGIIEDRIYQKEEILRKLRDEKRPLDERFNVARQDFGDLFMRLPIHFSDKYMQEEINAYSDYVDMVRSGYSEACKLAQYIQSSSNNNEKNTHKNNLYYFLSYQIPYFQCYLAEFEHIVPEHSREDTFYEIIREKLCADASKEYDIVTHYLKLTATAFGIKKQIDDKKLKDAYIGHQIALKEKILNGHPVFYTCVQNRSSEALLLFNQIQERMSQFPNRITGIIGNLSQRIREYQDDADMPRFYNIFGPYILEAVHDYEACDRDFRNALQTIEADLKKWLDKFKDSPAFRRLESNEKSYIREYIEFKNKEVLDNQRIADEEKRAIEAAAKEEKRLVAARKQREKDARRKEKKKALKAEEDASSSHVAGVNALAEETDILNAMSLGDPDTKISADSSAKVAMQGETTASVARATAGSVMAPTFQAKWEILPDPGAPKEKVKTRGHTTEEKEETIMFAKAEAKTDLIRPEYFSDTAFQTLIENLLNERNERKLKSDFSCLKKEYDIPSENQERKNKGYFMVVSPITQKRTVKTYHNLHDPENPFASVFMAVRDVLTNSQLTEYK